MKKIFFWLILFGLQLSAQIQPNPVNLGGLRIQGFYTDQYGVTVNSTQKLLNNVRQEIISSTEINLLPGFDASLLSNVGLVNARIAPSDLLPVSFHPSGWNNIGIYDRFEVGVRLPPSVSTQVEGFLNGGTGINPYDPDQVEVRAIFRNALAPSMIWIRQGFYYRDITLTGNGYIQSQSAYPFRVRFAPPISGIIDLRLELYVNGNLVDSFEGIRITVDNYWHAAPLSLNGAGKLKDARGNTVFAAGQSIAFAEDTDNASPNNAAFNDQRNYINDLINNSGNMVRVRLDPWSNEIEWEELGIYGSNRDQNSKNFLRQYHAYQLDKTFDVCEGNNIYMFLTLMQDQTLNTDDHYGTNSNWDLSKRHSPYSTIISNPEDFLSNNQSKDYFKKKLRYIIARWGYSANLGIYSLMNESNGVGDYKNNSATRSHMEAWHCEMSAYLKSFYPAHLVTTGYTADGTSLSSTANKDDNSFACPNIDIASCNHYSTSRDVHQERHDDIPKRVSHNPNKNIHTLIKPFIFGELGMTDCKPASDGYTDAEFHNSLWSTSMYSNAIGNGLYWYDWGQHEGINHRQNYRALKTFFDNWTMGTNHFTSNWSYAGSLSKDNRKIEYTEAVSPDKKKGYGWVKNAD